MDLLLQAADVAVTRSGGAWPSSRRVGRAGDPRAAAHRHARPPDRQRPVPSRPGAGGAGARRRAGRPTASPPSSTRSSTTRTGGRRWRTRCAPGAPRRGRSGGRPGRGSRGRWLSGPSGGHRPHAARGSIHVVGVGGAGMSAIAIGARRAWATTCPAATSRTSRGARAAAGPAASTVARRPRRRPTSATLDAVAVSTAIPERNPRCGAARERGHPRAAPRRDPRRHRRHPPHARGGGHARQDDDVVDARPGAASRPGCSPSFIIGGDAQRDRHRARSGTTASWFVVEADESDGTFLELPRRARRRHQRRGRPPRPLRRRSRRIEAAFDRFLADAPGPQRRVRRRPGRGPRSAGAPRRRHLRHRRRRRLPHRRPRAGRGRRAVPARARRRASSGRSRLPVPGAAQRPQRRRRDRAGAAAGRRPSRPAGRALARYAGVARRFQFRGEAGGVTFVDDYAHLPARSRAVLAAAARRRLGPGRVPCSSPTATAHRRALAPTSPTPSSTPTSWSSPTSTRPARRPGRASRGKLIVDAVLDAPPLEAGGLAARAAATSSPTWPAELRPGDLCLTLGAGDLTSLPDELLAPASSAAPAVVGRGRARRRTPSSGRRPRARARDVPARPADDLPGRAARPRCSSTSTTPRTSARSPGPSGRRPCAGARRRAGARTSSSPTPASTGWRSCSGDAFADGRASTATARSRRAVGGRRALPGRGPAHGRPRASTGFEWAVGVPGLDRRRGADERRRPRLRHGRRRSRGSASSTCAAGEDGRVPAAAAATSRYRHSAIGPSQVVVSAELRLDAGRRGRGRGRIADDRALAPRATSRAARTPARCSPTRRATRPAG